MTLTEAKSLQAGDFIHTPNQFNTDGTPMRARVTSVKTWKRSPNRIEVRCKHGMYDYVRFDETELDQIEKRVRLMTRKDYVLLAGALYDTKPMPGMYPTGPKFQVALRVWRITQGQIKAVLKQDNPRFNDCRFDSACGL